MSVLRALLATIGSRVRRRKTPQDKEVERIVTLYDHLLALSPETELANMEPLARSHPYIIIDAIADVGMLIEKDAARVLGRDGGFMYLLVTAFRLGRRYGHGRWGAWEPNPRVPADFVPPGKE